MNKKINFIGDSHSVLTFGQTILDRLGDVNLSVHFLAYSGLKLQYLTEPWAQPESLTISNFESKPGEAPFFSADPAHVGQSFQINKADILVVALGTNDIVECSQLGADYPVTIGPKIRDQLKRVVVERVFFLEPPLLGIDVDLKIRKELMTDIAAWGAKIIECSGFRADQLDGIHMKGQTAKSFGDHVSKQLLKAIFPHH